MLPIFPQKHRINVASNPNLSLFLPLPLSISPKDKLSKPNHALQSPQRTQKMLAQPGNEPTQARLLAAYDLPATAIAARKPGKKCVPACDRRPQTLARECRVGARQIEVGEGGRGRGRGRRGARGSGDEPRRRSQRL